MANQDEMDEAAEEAADELVNLDPESIKVVATWWNSWFRKAGHKRLGRLLVATARAGIASTPLIQGTGDLEPEDLQGG